MLSWMERDDEKTYLNPLGKKLGVKEPLANPDLDCLDEALHINPM